MTYHHLTQEERYTIYEKLHRGGSFTEIAADLGRSKSTVSREIRRNHGQRGYRPSQAEGLAVKRRKTPRGGRRVHAAAWAFCQTLIEDGHSPEQAAGRARRQKVGAVSHEYLYRRIYAD